VIARASRPRPRDSGLLATERPPRLVLRFVVVLTVALAAASALILVLVHHFAISESERSATRHASLVAATLLQQEVERSDLERVVSRGRRRELDTMLRSPIVASDTIAVSLVREDGLVTYSTNPGVMGAVVSPPLAAEAAGGTVVSRVSRTARADGSGRTKTLETYAPVRRGLRNGGALIVQSYAPIEHAARRAQFRVGAVLEGLLLLLFLVFVPLLARVTRRIGRQIERIHQQAYYDDLTGLPNRAHLFERLELAVRRGTRPERRIAVLLLDLDRFREINDTLGHEAGDLLLAGTAARLEEAAADDALLARLSGDEFAVVVEVADEEDALAYAEQLRAAVEPPLVVGGVPLAVEATVGLSLHPNDGEDAATLLKHAEIATYTAKEWKVGVLGYSPAIDPHDPEQLGLVAALREASNRDELVLHYQPKIDLGTGVVVGFEALAYWQHPTRGLLPPRAFVPVAERTGAIRHLSRAVLTRAVRQLREWESIDPGLTVAVNLTAIDLLDLELPQQLEDLLHEYEVDPRHLCIEITESTVMADPQRASSTLERIVSTGVRASIDDFGTGHSSLAYLKNLPVHEVKIDRSFVAALTVSPHDRLIVHAMIELAHNLGLQVVAEGVETDAVDAALRQLHCDQAQGYLYARPQPAESLTSLLPGWKVRPKRRRATARTTRPKVASNGRQNAASITRAPKSSAA
jgi:diguanylate cyclase (GGDEF)-like protein